jgi:hypothetical protein
MGSIQIENIYIRILHEWRYVHTYWDIMQKRVWFRKTNLHLSEMANRSVRKVRPQISSSLTFQQ